MGRELSVQGSKALQNQSGPIDQLEIDIFGEQNPDSIINKMGGELKEALLGAREQYPQWFEMNEAELREDLNRLGKRTNVTDNVLRTQFWIEYNTAILEGRPIRAKRVHAGICSEVYFYGLLKKRPEKIAWLVQPPISYLAQMTEALEFATSKMREILAKEADSFAHINERIAMRKLQSDIYKYLDTKVAGAPVQKTMNMHIHSNAIEGIETHSMAQLDKRLKDLRTMENEILAKNALKQGPEPELTEEDEVNGVILDE